MYHTSPVEEHRDSLRSRLAYARRVTDSLFEMLKPEALLSRPIRERHRVIFYLGHLEAFDWNLLGRTTFAIDPFNAEFDDLFAFGIDPVDDSFPDDVPSDWPRREFVDAYVREVRSKVDRLLARADLDTTGNLHNGKVFDVAVEHRLMHAETLAYMLHWLPFGWKRPLEGGSRLPDRPGRRDEQVPVPAGVATLGLARDGSIFGWDNEFDLTRAEVPDFRIDAHNVTNRQFLDFVESGGYADRSLWSDDDWAWRSREGIGHPRFWELHDGRWMIRNMFDVRCLPGSWPVYVSHAEASAYARWAGRSLPTEAQLHRAAYGTPAGEERPYPWGDEPPDASRGNFDFNRWDPAPVGSYRKGDSAFGVSDLLGNGWEWTSTLFRPFDGFERFEFYPGYSADFFDDNHFVMKGGSTQTSMSMLRRSFRNWFQPHYPNIYATFRCIES